MMFDLGWVKWGCVPLIIFGSTMKVKLMSDRTGLLSRYHLIRKLGSGTFGRVYLARDRYRHNDVAIKILHSLADDELPKFLIEARMMRLKHPNIIQILDFGIEEQTPFLVMEYAPCGDLRERHPKGSHVPLPTIVSYVTQLASALQAAHDDQIIHRDVKPENMLLNQQGQVLLSDFGIATMVPDSTLESAQSFFVGTIPYMAPEQAEGHACLASDQYALAVVVYEWLCGQRPFQGSPIEIAIQHRVAPPPSLCEQNPMISPEVERVILTALAKKPDERFSSVEAFAQALEIACSVSSIPTRILLSNALADSIPQEVDNTETTAVIARLTPVEHEDTTYEHIIFNRRTILSRYLETKSIRTSLTTLYTIIACIGSSIRSLRCDANQALLRVHRKNCWINLIAAVLMGAVLLVVGDMVISAIGDMGPTIVTITPDSKIEQDHYIIQAVTGKADPAKSQISLRQLTFSPQKLSKSVTATGVGWIGATRASGTLVLYNGSVTNLLVRAGTRIRSADGIWVSTDRFVDVPARMFGNVFTAVFIPAHSLYPGKTGNIRALAINQYCCSFSNAIEIQNPYAFSGGQDAQNYTFLKQSDIDGVFQQIKLMLYQQALDHFKRQIKSNEQLLGGPQCTMQTNVDQPVGDHRRNVTSANVTVNATCTGLAYDVSGVQALIQTLLKRKAISDPGRDYMLADTIVTKLQATHRDTKRQSVTLNLEVSRIWCYWFDDQQRQMLARQLVGKSRATAQRILSSYTGIAKATIQVAGGGTEMPDNPRQISIRVSEVSGDSSTETG
jgi:serine/threonine protein kinase